MRTNLCRGEDPDPTGQTRGKLRSYLKTNQLCEEFELLTYHNLNMFSHLSFTRAKLTFDSNDFETSRSSHPTVRASNDAKIPNKLIGLIQLRTL